MRPALSIPIPATTSGSHALVPSSEKPKTNGEMANTMPAIASSVKCTGSGTMFATLSSQSVIRL
jgi:hypothetical protein